MTLETPLEGGVAHPGEVVRVGDTVRRPAGAHTASVHAMLAHLRSVGFDGAPEPLGIDERGREVLSFIPGDVPVPPYPLWALRDETLESVARLLYRFHDAVRGFDASGLTWSSEFAEEPDGDIVVHNDYLGCIRGVSKADQRSDENASESTISVPASSSPPWGRAPRIVLDVHQKDAVRCLEEVPPQRLSLDDGQVVSVELRRVEDQGTTGFFSL
jgi:hypothetical protein